MHNINDIVGIDSNFFTDENGIVRQKALYSDHQEQTKDTFSFKWEKKDTYSSEQVKKVHRNWLMSKYFDNDLDLYHKVFERNAVVLDAGCGAGLSAECLFGSDIDELQYIGVDISTAVDEAKKRFEDVGFSPENKLFIQCDLNNIPLKSEVDVIFSEGVLHHTDSTQTAIKNLSKHLRTGGIFAFYVYAKKSPIREFTDDYIRDYFKDRSNQETWDELQALTKLGKQLGELNIDLNIEDDIPYLGIKKGHISLQRFFYWYIFKCFYREDYTLDEMNHINFDWYRPTNCHRQTPEQVQKWCEDAGLRVERMHVEEAGITVLAEKL